MPAATRHRPPVARARANATRDPQRYGLPAFRSLPPHERVAAEALAAGEDAAEAARRACLSQPLVVSLCALRGFAEAVQDVREARETWLRVAADVTAAARAPDVMRAIVDAAMGNVPRRPKRIGGRVVHVCDARAARVQLDAAAFVLAYIGCRGSDGDHSPARAFARRDAEALAVAWRIVGEAGRG